MAPVSDSSNRDRSGEKDREKDKSSRRRDREDREKRRHSRSSDGRRKDRDDHERRRHHKSSRNRDRQKDRDHDQDPDRKSAAKKSDRRDDMSAEACPDGENSEKRRRSKHSSSSKRRHDSDRNRDGDRHRKEHRDASRKSSKHSSKKREREGRKGNKSERHSKKLSKDKLHDIGKKALFPPKVLLDPSNDYFTYHDHLRLYLYRSEGIFFEDLTSVETHKAFKTFCSKYNKGDLEQGYYTEQLDEDALQQCKRTKHAWNFQTSTAENKSLDLIRSGVKKQTSYDVNVPDRNSGLKAKSTAQPLFTGGTSQPKQCIMIAPRDDAKEMQRYQPAIAKGYENENRNEQQEAMLKSLGLGGLKPGEKIRIAPRKA